MDSPSETPSSAESRRASPGASVEIAVVFGLTVGTSLLGVAMGRRGLDFGDQRLLRTIAVEALMVVTLWPWLRRRGWSFSRIAGAPEPLDVVRGIGLACAAYLAYYAAAITWAVFAPGGFDQLRSVVPSGSPAPWVVVLVSVVNPIFEEFLWLAYGITALRRFGAGRAVVASAMLRLLVHTYQGAMAVVGVLPLGLVFGYYYARSRRIWPVIVAHLLFDVLALSALAR